jgi:hypothetical protein
MKNDARYMTARQASAALDVSIGTLYSYVSRGTLHSESVVGKPRLRRYLKEDVARLIERKEFRKNPGKAAVRGLHWGSPVLDSALTLIDGGRLFYRGIDAIQLAQRATVEEVAALLWTGDSSQAGYLFENKDAGVSPKLRGLCERTAHVFPTNARWEAILQRGRMAGQSRLRIRHRNIIGPWMDYLLVSKRETRRIVKGTGWRISKLHDSRRAPRARYIMVLTKT